MALISHSVFTEYVFTLPDGSKRYEIVDITEGLKQVEIFRRMHGADRAAPLNKTFYGVLPND